MKKALAAFALLCALTSLAPPSRGQTSISPSAGSVVYVHFPGAPTGGCATEQQAKNEATADFYVCFAGAWLKVTGSGGGAVGSVFGRTGTVTATAGDYTLAQITGGVAQAGAAYDFSNVIVLLPSSAGYTSNALGRCGYDSTLTNWHCWDGADAIVALLAPGSTPTTGDVATWINSSGNINLTNSTPVGGGTSFLKASGIAGALNGDFLHQDNTGIWRAVTPGVPGRTATTTTEPISWTSGTGDRNSMVSLTNASLVTSAIPQCGVAPAVSNPFTTAWITGAAGAKFTSTVSTLNGIAPATGITYPGNTRVDVTCPDNANYTLLASRAFKGGTGILETLNADGTVTGNITGHSLSGVLNCSAASASGTTYTCATTPSFTPADGDAILFEADVASTGAVTLNVNASSAAPVKKQGGGTALVANDFLAGQDVFLIYDGTNWQMQGQLGNAASGGVSRLDQITSATASPTALANGNFPQTWNWALTTDSTSAFTLGETSAATNGTVTAGGLANESILKIIALTGSLATPLSIVQGAMSGAVAIPAFQISQGSNTGTTAFPLMQLNTTWNGGAGLSARGLVFAVTNTSSSNVAGASRLLSLQAGASGTTDEFWADSTGNAYLAGSLRFNTGTAIQGQSSSQNLTFIGGQDSSNVALTGLAIYRTADNSNTTAASAAGSTTARGGDELGATSNATVGGAFIARGGNVTSTSTTATPGAASLTGGGFTGAATNGVGADTTVAGGLGTGNATPSHVFIKAPGFGAASGSTAQTSVTRYVIHSKAGSTTTATATNMFNIALANNQTAGARIHVHVETTQGTPQNCSTSSEFFIAAQDTAGTVTTNVSSAVGTATICSTGTLTLTLAASAAAPSVISVTPSWTTIVPTAVIITVGIENLSQQDVALL